jgi:hypothetical protein
MGKWEHLFIDGEFAPRAHLLSGLTLGLVNLRPPGMPHSIYEELWHTAKWQTIVVRRDARGAAEWNAGGQRFPSVVPDSDRMWVDLVAEFLAGAEKATEWGRSREAPMEEVSPGVTYADELEGLAIHNAYHLGKIVALRQVIGAWPPQTE